MKNSKDPFGSKTDEARTVLNTRCVVVALIAFIAGSGFSLLTLKRPALGDGL
jgi:hypothetical protein